MTQALSLQKSRSVHFEDEEPGSSRCKYCGTPCALITYQSFASTYVNNDEIDEVPLELINNDSMIEEKSNYNDGTDEKVLTAKRKYLRFHHKLSEESIDNRLKCIYNPCFALQKAQNTAEVLNNLTELEQAHITFYHHSEFDKHWNMHNRHRNCRYSHHWSSISNRYLNEELKSIEIPIITLSNSCNISEPSFASSISSNPSVPGSLKYTKSVKYQKVLIKKQKNKKPSSDVILFGFEFITKKGKFNNPKEEVLKNELVHNAVKVREWNNLLRSCSRYVKMRNAKYMKLNMKQVIALKLYTDFDELQKEFRKCFRIRNIEKRIEIQKNFVHWNDELVNAYKKAKDDIKQLLYHGVRDLNKTSTFNGKYYGPVSTTTILDVAKQFSGDSGTVLVLHTTYSMRGIRLAWLSNYPDEDEVLYMNVTFQITDIIDPKSEKSKLWPINYHYELEQIQNALQEISINSNVLSLNEHQKEGSDNVMVINKISILNLLYLQYAPNRWHQICEHDTEYAITLSAIRDQFVHLIEKVKAVQMDNTSPLIQDFFSSDQSDYTVPKNTNIHQFNNNFKDEKHYFKLQTIIRLFPETEEISINAKNWDFTLNQFIQFLTKWRYDYTAVSLKYISLKFDKTMLNKTCDERAIQELEKHYASNNISKVLKLGWKFLTPSRLTRVPFDPPPELPFLLTFTQRDSVVFYRTYTKRLLNKESSHKSLEGCEEDDDKKENNNDNQDIDDITEIHHNPKICILSTAIWDKIEYKNDLKKLLNKVKLNMLQSPKGPGAIDALDLERSRSVMNESFQRACDDVRRLTLEPLPQDLMKIFKPKDIICYQTIYDIFSNVADIFLRETQFTLKECRRLCDFLKEKRESNRYIPFERIFYKEQTEEEKEHIGSPLNWMRKSVVFTTDYESDECQENDMSIIEEEVYIPKMAKMLKESGDWCFQANGQIAFCNDIYKHHQDRNMPYVQSKV